MLNYGYLRIRRRKAPKTVDPSKPIKAAKIVKNPALLDDITNTYVLLKDSTFIDNFEKLILAMNLLAARGWETVSIAGLGTTSMYALLRRVDEAKNGE
jgi:hypothetical protein